MGYISSPTNPPPASFRETALRQLKALFLQVFRRTTGFLDAHKLPYAANKACQLYLGKADPAKVAECRRILRSRLELNPQQLQYFFQTSLGDHLLLWLSGFFYLSADLTFKDLLLQIAADPEGVSLLSFLRYSPDPLRLNLDQLVITTNRLNLLLQAGETAIAAIRDLSAAEARLEAEVDLGQFPDLQKLGPFQVKQYSFRVERSQQSDLEGADLEGGAQSPLQVFCYAPQACPAASLPVIIQSHGLASSPEDLAEYAKHLASYGYFVAAPQHTGSDVVHVREMLAGRSQEVFAQSEFIRRPLDISDTLDELERRNLAEFDGRLNLQSVGMMGYSFGAYTAFVLAGAKIDFEQLKTACGETLQHPNLSLLLQCQALNLPRQSYSLQDDRIQAILTMESLGSELLGLEGLKKVQVPTLLLAGSRDIAAPLALEQVRIFQWLSSPQRYLALMHGKSHMRDVPRLVRQLDLQIKRSPQVSTPQIATPFDGYTQALSVAFFNQHLPQACCSSPAFHAGYTAAISRSPFDVWLISQESSQQLRQALEAANNELLAEALNFEKTSSGAIADQEETFLR